MTEKNSEMTGIYVPRHPTPQARQRVFVHLLDDHLGEFREAEILEVAEPLPEDGRYRCRVLVIDPSYAAEQYVPVGTYHVYDAQSFARKMIAENRRLCEALADQRTEILRSMSDK